MLWTTDESTGTDSQSTMINASKKNQGAPSDGASRNIDGDIKNLSYIVKLAKAKKPNFAKDNFKSDFLISGAKDDFIHL